MGHITGMDFTFKFKNILTLFTGMKTIISFILLVITVSMFAQQKETFDLAAFIVPDGWQKVIKDNDAIGYTINNAQKGSYCQIAIYRSMKSLGNIQSDFEEEWKVLIADVFQVTVKPELRAPISDDGWVSMSGFAPFDFNGGKSIAMLVTISGYTKRLSIIILSNTQDYKKDIDNFLASVDLKKPAPNSTGLSERQGDMPPFLGTWVKSSGINQSSADSVSGGNSGYIKSQYTFNQDGTYSFISKTFNPAFDKILLVKESGTFKINGNGLSINPQNSVNETWSKKNSTDNFDKLISTEPRALEKTTYKFVRRYLPGIQEWNLVLESGRPTLRDGSFSGNTKSGYAWYYFPVSETYPEIDLPVSDVVP
jgi:hypothetical protein